MANQMGQQAPNDVKDVKDVVKAGFALIGAALFAIPAFYVLRGALQTPAFAPIGAQTFLLDTFGTAIVAFIAAQLGITVARAAGGAFRAQLTATMGSRIGMVILVIDVIVVLIIGIAFIVLWVNPGLIQVPDGSDPLKEAPEYVATQAKLFVGLVVAAVTAVGTSA